MVGGRGRGRSRAAPPDPSPAIGGPSGCSPAPSVSAPSTVGGRRACEACEAAPGMPFCRVEWSFLCASCGPALHRNSWIVAVPPFPGPTPTNPSIAGAGTDPSQPPPHPYYLPPFMQMPPMPPMHTPFQMPVPHVNPTNPGATGAAAKRRRRRPRVVSSSKEQVPDPAPADTDTDPEHDRVEGDSESVMHHGMKRKIRSQPPPSTRTDIENSYTELHPGVEDAMITNFSESTQVDAIENLAAEMEPPPPELDELEQVIEAQEDQ